MHEDQPPIFSKSFISFLSFFLLLLDYMVAKWYSRPTLLLPNIIKTVEPSSLQIQGGTSRRKLQRSKEKSLGRSTTPFCLSFLLLSILSSFYLLSHTVDKDQWRPWKINDASKELKVIWRPKLWRLRVSLQLLKLWFNQVYLLNLDLALANGIKLFYVLFLNLFCMSFSS